MDNTADTAQVIIRPPLAWGLGVIAGLALNWLVPLPFLPANLPAAWFGAMVFVLALSPGVHLRQKSLKRVGESSVYLTVCWMLRCPR